MNFTPGTLYMVATPIGNLSDITHRAVEVLQGVDVVYAEDTRVTRGLFTRYEIMTLLRSYREAASREQVDKTIHEIVTLLKQGKMVAFVSDAGTPALSDPGTYLVRRVQEHGGNVSPIPGPSAYAAIISIAGRGTSSPLFVGFLPKKKGHQTKMAQLNLVLREQYADSLIFYESPERVVKFLGELKEWNVPVHVTVGRELTKLHEEIIAGELAEVTEIFATRKNIKGEFVILVSLGTITES